MTTGYIPIKWIEYIAKSRDRKPHTASSGHCMNKRGHIARRMARQPERAVHRRATPPWTLPKKTGIPDWNLKIPAKSLVLHRCREGRLEVPFRHRLIDDIWWSLAVCCDIGGTYFPCLNRTVPTANRSSRRSALCSARAQGLSYLLNEGR